MKTSIRLKIVVISFLFVSVNLFGQDNPQSIVDNFFANYEKKGAEEAIDLLYATNKWMERKSDGINNLKSQLSRFNEGLVGEYFGHVFIDKIKTSDCYEIHTYFMKFDRQPLRLTFHFYKASDK